MEPGRRRIVEWVETAAGSAEKFRPAHDETRVEAPVGSGGMGEVFLLTDRDLRCQVARKGIRACEEIGRDERLHFVAEAQAPSLLEHPGIPPLHDLGLTPTGRKPDAGFRCARDSHQAASATAAVAPLASSEAASARATGRPATAR